MPSSRGASQLRDQTQVSCIVDRFFTTEPPGKPQKVKLCLGNSPAAQWLGLYDSTAAGRGLLPGLGTKILQATQHCQK